MSFACIVVLQKLSLHSAQFGRLPLMVVLKAFFVIHGKSSYMTVCQRCSSSTEMRKRSWSPCRALRGVHNLNPFSRNFNSHCICLFKIFGCSGRGSPTNGIRNIFLRHSRPAKQRCITLHGKDLKAMHHDCHWAWINTSLLYGSMYCAV